MAELWICSVDFWRTLISLIDVRALATVWIVLAAALLAAAFLRPLLSLVPGKRAGGESAGAESLREDEASPSATAEDGGVSAAKEVSEEVSAPPAAGYTSESFDRLPGESRGESAPFTVVTSDNTEFRCLAVRKTAPDYVTLVLAADGKTVRLRYENIAKVLK